MDWKSILSMASKTFSDNKPAILFGTGVACLGACVVLTAKAAPKAKDKMDGIFEEYAYEMDTAEVNSEEEFKSIRRDLVKKTAKRTFKEVAPEYVPSLLAGVASITAFALSNRQLSKEAVGAIAACNVAERALGAYQDGVIKELGEEVHDKILSVMVDDVPDEVLEKTDGYLEEGDTANRFKPDANDKLYYDHVTGRMFWSTDEKIKDAESTVNKLLIDTGIATINDFYSALLLDCDSVVGDAIGWRVEDPHARNMDVIFGSRLDRENNTPLITIGYRTCAVNLRELERR